MRILMSFIIFFLVLTDFVSKIFSFFWLWDCYTLQELWYQIIGLNNFFLVKVSLLYLLEGKKKRRFLKTRISWNSEHQETSLYFLSEWKAGSMVQTMGYYGDALWLAHMNGHKPISKPITINNGPTNRGNAISIIPTVDHPFTHITLCFSKWSGKFWSVV